MALLDHVRDCLRQKATSLDVSEIIPIIEACKCDMKRVGIVNISEDDPLVERAVVLYAKGNFGYSDDAPRFVAAYEGLRDSMSLSGFYNEVQGGA